MTVLDHYPGRLFFTDTELVQVGVGLHGLRNDMIASHWAGKQGIEDDPGHRLDRGFPMAVAGCQAGVVQARGYAHVAVGQGDDRVVAHVG